MTELADNLVGRAEELGCFDAAIAHLATREPLALEVVGEPGIGKTRLLAELGRRADAHGQLVLSGCASELERDLPFWVFVDALDEYVEGLEPRRLDRLSHDVRVELAHVLPSLEATDGASTPWHDERYRAHRAIRELLELLAATKPLVLALDDLQWADAASVELIGALLRRPAGGPVLMAMARRTEPSPARLSAALERARRLGSLTRLEPHRLTQAQSATLLGDRVDVELAAVLHRESGGNPFYLEQLGRSSHPPGRPAAGSPIDFGPITVPPMVAAALTEELAALSPTARRALEGAAVVGDPFDIELAAASAGLPDPTAVTALDELLQHGLVRQTEVPRRFGFRHPLVRRAVYEATAPGWRLTAHERAAVALSARGAAAVARAPHVERFARQGDTAAVAVLRAAGDAAAPRAPASAGRWFGGALRLLPEAAPDGERVELLLALAGALAASGQFADSHAALLESLARVPGESTATRVELIIACAGIERLLGRHDEAHERLARALGELRDDAPERVSLMLELATDAFYRVQYEAMHGWAVRARDSADALDDPSLTAAATAALALACTCTGAIAEADGHRRHAAALIDALSDEELSSRLDAATSLATAEVYLDRYGEAERRCTRAIAVARATGQGALFPVLTVLLGAVTLMTGRPGEAAELLDGAVEAARLSGNDQVLALNLLNQAQAVLAEGDVDAAIALAEESVALGRELDDSLLGHWAGEALAAALLEAREPERAVESLLGAAGGESLSAIPSGFRVNALELLVRCLLALGRREDAARVAAHATEAAAALGLGVARCTAHRASAAVALDAGDAATAAEHARAATAAAEAAGVPIEAARSRVIAGRALAMDGRREPAVEELERAAAELQACGALRWRDEAERELRRLGRRIHRRSRPAKADGVGVASLTARELEVGRLVVDRRTNAEIAATLFLSRKTIETHLRNIFFKLAVSSRADVARAIEQADEA